MRYLLAHRTRRILFLFILLPTAAVAYMTLPRGDVRLPAENVRARTQDIAIPASAPSVPRGKFMEPPRAYVSQGAGVRTPADEAAIAELALSAAASPANVTPPTGAALMASGGGVLSSTPAQTAKQGGSSSGSRAYPQMLARGMEGAALSVSGVSRSGAAEQTGDGAQAAQPTTTAMTTTALTTTSTAVSSTSSSQSTSSSGPSRGPAAGAAVVAGGQNALENTDETPAQATVTQVFSGPASGANQGGPNTAAPGGSPSASPSPTPEPATLLLLASGLGLAYGARRYVL